MKKLSFVSSTIKFNVLRKNFAQRTVLFFLALILGFGLIEPGISHALTLSNAEKKFDINYDLKPLKSDTQDEARDLTQDGGPIAPDSLKPKIDNPRGHKYEEVSKRTAFSSTYVNNDGTKTKESSTRQQNYKSDNKWEKIDNTLTPVDDLASSANILQNTPGFKANLQTPSVYKAKAGALSIAMNPLAQGLHLSVNGKNFVIQPVGANNSKPEKKDETTVVYREAWKGVDLEYEVRGELLKENIIVKSKDAAKSYEFKVAGAKLIDDPKNPGLFTIEGLDDGYRFGALTLMLNDRGAIKETPLSQRKTDHNTIEVSVDEKWLASLPTTSFPLTIDPSFGKWDADPTDWMFKSDGYSCQGNTCWMRAGTLYDNGWKHWRTYVQFPHGELLGKRILDANIHGYYNPNAGPDPNQRYLFFGHANCIGWECRGTHLSTMLVGSDFDVNVKNRLQERVNVGDTGVVWSLWGEEVPYKTLKVYSDMYFSVVYDTPTPVSTQLSPANGQVTVDTQPTLKGSTVSDPDGAAQYYFRVSTNNDANSGAVINSGWISSPQWTIPDGILQDGTTYYWKIYTRDDTSTSVNSESSVSSFKVDLRNGKDTTQTYDTVGPVDINLATGNATVENGSHTMSALGGSLGVGLSYNTPNRAKKGLKAEYWNIDAGYNFSAGAPTSTPAATRVDQNINFDWGNANPDSRINSDHWFARWTGKITIPTTGAYTFGGADDDEYALYINGTKVAGAGCCTTAANYAGSTPVNLTAGQVVDLKVEFREYTGAARMQLFVKGPVAEQIVPRDWLYTDDPNGSKLYGLMGRYYTDNANAHDLDAAAKDAQRLMFARQDTKMNLDFGAGGPATSMQVDNFMTRWTGYITVPSSGDYQIGAYTDDGLRVKLNNGLFGTQTTPIDAWRDQAATIWSGNTHIDGNVAVPITVDWFEHGGGAALKLYIRGNGYAEQEMPVSWLSPKANALPDGWQLNLDVDGSVAYERLRVSGSSVILEDSSRQTHEYTSTGSGFKPPVNEDGVLVKNTDNSYTLTDVDGRVYIFDAAGQLKSVTTPADDRQPAALKYEYGNDPSRLLKIIDGVSAARYATLHYKGIQEDNMCVPPSGFDNVPNGMLCALKTSDGDVTRFHYQLGQLARIEEPGNELTDYRYNIKGQIDTIRDSLAGDAIAAGVRVNDETVATRLTYDLIGRINSVTAPAATAGASRLQHTFEYIPSIMGSAGAAQMHIAGSSETNGFSKRVEYDTLLRSIKVTDLSGQSVATEWDTIKDLQLSTTDTIGLKSTTIYDADDRPIDSYGPAPAAWFGSDRRPMASYTNQVPRTSTGFDEGINGPAVTYMAINQRTSSVLPTGASLSRGQNIVSPDGRYNFIYQTDGNVVLYGPTGAIWNNGKTNVASDRLVMQGDGNLVLYNGGTPVWSSNTGGGNSPYLKVQNDANVVIYNSTGSVWNTGTGGQSYTIDNPTSLIGTPLLNKTNLTENSTKVSNSWTSSPVPSGSNYWGVRMTGKLRLPTTGNWTFRIVSDNGVRMSVNDSVVINDWNDGAIRSHPTYTFNNTGAGSSPRLSIDYYHLGGSSANFTLYITPPGQAETSDVAQYASPGYGLTTSRKAYDAQLGDVESKMVYKDPTYGILDKTVIDPAGLNYESRATYEASGAGYLRQTSKTLPGGTVTTYGHYGKDDIADNPCTSEVEAYHQAGMPKSKSEMDPDGSGPQTGRISETRYNEAGDVIAIRYNQDPWTCMTYDARGRTTTTSVAGVSGRLGRTITNNYAVGGSPLVTSTADGSGTITVENDLLGRLVKYTDAKGKVATNAYDDLGKLVSRTSVLGTESYVYDSYDRLTSYKLDNITFATITYDTYGRLETVQYPAGIKLGSVTRDQLGRENGTTYTLSDGTIVSDQVTRSVSGDITNGVENGLNKNYTYDSIGRLTNAKIGADTFNYEFGAPDASCNSLPGNNNNAAKNGNRTKLNVNGVITTYCYDMADRLIASSDTRLSGTTYDDHGNVVKLGSAAQQTKFGYDAGDRNMSISQTLAANTGENTTSQTKTTEVAYTRDVQDRIVDRQTKENGSIKDISTYSFTGTGDSPDALLDANGTVIQKYVTLPGDVVMTIKPQSTSAGMTTYSIPNIHGDVMATVNADGSLTGRFMTGPFGEPLTTTEWKASPVNTASGASWQYVGQNQKLTESGLSLDPVQMGARVYLPILGRFISTDPQEGGTDNSYVYVNDPVNEFDLDGRAGVWDSLKKGIKAVTKIADAVSYIPGPIGSIASGVAVAGNLAQGNWKGAAIAAVGLTGVGVAGKFAVKAVTSVKVAKQFKSSMTLGRQAHKDFQRKYKTGETAIKGAGRADGVVRGRLIELKPHNNQQIKLGVKQLAKYVKHDTLKRQGQLWTYNRNWFGKLVYKCQRGC